MDRRLFLKNLCSIAAAGVVCAVAPDVLAKGYERAVNEEDLKDYLHGMANFDKPQPEDIILNAQDFALLKSTLKRLRKVQRTVGFGNYCILSFDDAIKFSRNYSSIGSFTRQEKDFLDRIFHFNAQEYGFFGKKPVTSMTEAISRKKLIKVPRTGNFLYRGEPFEKYQSIKKELGKKVYLTSGVRGVMKQFVLFLSKTAANNGNLSLASRSLAPPGYSYHAVGDFDVGEKGLGAANFSSRFAESETCARLRKSGYLKLRYPQNNLLGVRFEPWHIKV